MQVKAVGEQAERSKAEVVAKLNEMALEKSRVEQSFQQESSCAHEELEALKVAQVEATSAKEVCVIWG